MDSVGYGRKQTRSVLKCDSSSCFGSCCCSRHSFVFALGPVFHFHWIYNFIRNYYSEPNNIAYFKEDNRCGPEWRQGGTPPTPHPRSSVNCGSYLFLSSKLCRFVSLALSFFLFLPSIGRERERGEREKTTTQSLENKSTFIWNQNLHNHTQALSSYRRQHAFWPARIRLVQNKKLYTLYSNKQKSTTKKVLLTEQTVFHFPLGLWWQQMCTEWKETCINIMVQTAEWQKQWNTIDKTCMFTSSNRYDIHYFAIIVADSTHRPREKWTDKIITADKTFICF